MPQDPEQAVGPSPIAASRTPEVGALLRPLPPEPLGLERRRTGASFHTKPAPSPGTGAAVYETCRGGGYTRTHRLSLLGGVPLRNCLSGLQVEYAPSRTTLRCARLAGAFAEVGPAPAIGWASAGPRSGSSVLERLQPESTKSLP